MKIVIDADACPKSVIEICKRLSTENDIELWTVASYNHNIISDNHIIVDVTSQAADIKIMNMISPGDIAITQDWGLASMLLGKGAKCLGPTGKEYTASNIDFLLEERQIKAEFRKAGGRTKGSKKRSLQDDDRFEASLRKSLQSI